MSLLGQMSVVIGVTTVGTQRAVREIQLMEATVRKAQVSMMSLGRSMTQFASLPAALISGAAVAQFAKFEFSIAKITGLVGIASDQAKAWGKDVLNMAGNVGKGANELADALYYITSSGFKGAESLKILEVSAKAAASGLGETKNVADIVTSAMNAYGASALSAAEATNVLVMAVREGKGEPEDLTRAFATVIPIGAKLGVEFHELGGALAALTRLGMPAATAATYLRQTLFTLTKPSKQTRDALKAMGTSAQEMRDSLENDGLLITLRRLGELTEKWGEEAMARVFPNIRAFMGIISLLQMDVDEVNEVFESTKNSSKALSDAFAAASDTLKFTWNRTMAEGQSMLIKFGESISEVLLPIVENLGNFFKRTGDWFDGLSKGMKNAIAGFILFVSVAGPALLILQFIKTAQKELTSVAKALFGFQVKSANAQTSALNQQNTALKQQISTTNAQIVALKKQIKNLNAQIVALKQQISAINAQTAAINKNTAAKQRNAAVKNSAMGFTATGSNINNPIVKTNNVAITSTNKLVTANKNLKLANKNLEEASRRVLIAQTKENASKDSLLKTQGKLYNAQEKVAKSAFSVKMAEGQLVASKTRLINATKPYTAASILLQKNEALYAKKSLVSIKATEKLAQVRLAAAAATSKMYLADALGLRSTASLVGKNVLRGEVRGASLAARRANAALLKQEAIVTNLVTKANLNKIPAVEAAKKVDAAYIKVLALKQKQRVDELKLMATTKVAETDAITVKRAILQVKRTTLKQTILEQEAERRLLVQKQAQIKAEQELAVAIAARAMAYEKAVIANAASGLNKKKILLQRRAGQGAEYVQTKAMKEQIAAANAAEEAQKRQNLILAQSGPAVKKASQGVKLLTGAFKGLGIAISAVGKFMMQNWLLVLLLGVPILINFIKKLNELKGAQKTLKDISDKVTESISSEKGMLEGYLSIAKNENVSKEERLRAIKELNKISPEYLGNIDEEALRTGKATAAINAYVDSLYKRLELEVATGELQELMAKRLKMTMQGYEGQVGFWDKIKAGVKSVLRTLNTSAFKLGYEIIESPVATLINVGKAFKESSQFSIEYKNALEEIGKVKLSDALQEVNEQIDVTQGLLTVNSSKTKTVLSDYNFIIREINRLSEKESEMNKKFANVTKDNKEQARLAEKNYQEDLQKTIGLIERTLSLAKSESTTIKEQENTYNSLNQKIQEGKKLTEDELQRLNSLRTMFSMGGTEKFELLKPLEQSIPALQAILNNWLPKVKDITDEVNDGLTDTGEKLTDLQKLQKDLTEAFDSYQTELSVVDKAAELYGKTTGVAADKVKVLETVINLAAQAMANSLPVDKAKLETVITLYKSLVKLDEQEQALAKTLEDGLKVQMEQYQAWLTYISTEERLAKANKDLGKSLTDMAEYVKYSGGEFTMAQAAVEIYSDHIKYLRSLLKGSSNKQDIFVEILKTQQQLKEAKGAVLLDEYRRSLELLEIEATIAGGSFATFGETLGFLENAYKALLDEGIRSGPFFDTVISGMMELRNLANTKDTFTELGSAFGELVSIFDLGEESWVNYVETILNNIPKIIEMIMSLTAATTLEQTINAARVESINNTQDALVNETIALANDTKAVGFNTAAIIANTAAKLANAAVSGGGIGGGTMGPPTQEQMLGGNGFSVPTFGNAAANIGTGMSAISGLGNVAKIAGNFSAILGGVMGVIAILSLLFKKKKKVGMALGGIVPPGYPNDSYPAMLTSGEAVIPAKRLPNFEREPLEVKVLVEGVVRGTDIHYINREIERRFKNSF
ncbi:MAG TPA: phage tail tape measure protein [Clostridiales bacterium]|nr:phage tail tape measure protein [Clostridiales bacterium]